MQIKSKKELKKYFWEQGYVIFNIKNEKLIDNVCKDVKKIIRSKKFKTNSKIYSYNSSPRIVESYKYSENCKKLSKLSKVKKLIDYIYDDKGVPFSTINFIKSTEQPLHSDYAHFGTLPENKIIGAWIALEDIDPNSGPLKIVPKSHKLKNYNFIKENKNKTPSSLREIKKNYEKYERYVRRIIKKKKLKVVTPKMKKGDCLLWESNMLHGSPNCKNNKLSRMSQVTHWTFRSVRKHYNPNFSDPRKNRYVERKVVFF